MNLTLLVLILELLRLGDVGVFSLGVVHLVASLHKFLIRNGDFWNGREALLLEHGGRDFKFGFLLGVDGRLGVPRCFYQAGIVAQEIVFAVTRRVL